MGDNTDPRAEDRPDRPEVPGACREADGQPHGEHDGDHRQISAEVNAYAEPCRVLSGGLALGIVAAKLRERQVCDELAQLAGGVRGEGGLQPVLVLVHREVALR